MASAVTPLIGNEVQNSPPLGRKSDILGGEARERDEDIIEIGLSLYFDVAVWGRLGG